MIVDLEFDPVPKLTIGDDVYYGINIVEQLAKLKKNSKRASELFTRAVSIHQRNPIPSLGFKLTHENAVAPTKRIIDVGYDMTAIDIYSTPTQLTTLYETHVALDIPLGYYAELVPRSSLSKTGYMFANSIGIIDPSYTGTVKIALIKVDLSMPDLELPARIAQIILKPYVVSESHITEFIHETTRGSDGFGSTG